MDKSFNSFKQIVTESGKVPSYKSFMDLAKSEFAKPVEENNSANLEDTRSEQTDQSAELEPMTERSVVDVLLEKLSDFGEYIPQEKPKPKEKVEKLNQEKIVKENKLEDFQKVEPQPIASSTEPENQSYTNSAESENQSYANSAGYKIFRDSDETFECVLSVEGTSLNDAKARIILESDSWSFIFDGKIFSDGRCVVPIKRGIPLTEGTHGEIRLEIIADDQLFVGWQDSFTVNVAKKIKVELKEHKSVKVSFDNKHK